MRAMSFGRVTLVRLVQPENDQSPTKVMLSGRMMLVRPVHSLNAQLPMVVTGNPSIVSRTVTSPPLPV